MISLPSGTDTPAITPDEAAERGRTLAQRVWETLNMDTCAQDFVATPQTIDELVDALATNNGLDGMRGIGHLDQILALRYVGMQTVFGQALVGTLVQHADSTAAQIRALYPLV